jgi:(p)ppGpp synthase/HD superfamily hydrolase
MTSVQDLYQNAIRFAAEKHGQQTIHGLELPYIVHLSNVAMEIMMMSLQGGNDMFDLPFAVQVALLHDTIEDTNTTYDVLKQHFGIDIADAVMAMTKNESLSKEQRMPDTISRIKELRKEVWAVKLADRITNMQKPPAIWSQDKRKEYLNEAQLIYNELGEGNEFLAERLKGLIKSYVKYLAP